jgi:tetratricopeptide (TPR) repeat protein
LVMRYFLLFLTLLPLSALSQNLANDIQHLQKRHQYAALIERLEGQNLEPDEELILINAYRQTGQTSLAIERLAKLWEADSLNIDVALALGETYYGRSQFRKAYPYFRTATLLDSTNGYYQKLAGRCAAKIDAIQINALGHYTKALELEPNDRNAAYQLARTFLAFDGVKDARAITQLFVKNDSTDRGMLILDTRLAYLDDSPESVIINYEYLLKQGDTISSLMRLYGSALYKVERYDEATMWLNNVLKVTPNEHAYFFLGMIKFKQMKFDTAATYLLKAIKETESPNLGEYYTNLALSLDNNGDYLEAIEVYNEAYLRTENPNLLFRMAIVNEELRRVQTARKQYQKFLDLTPDRVTNQRMYAEDRLKDLKVAEFMDGED